MLSREQIFTLLAESPVEIGHWMGFKDLTELHNGWLKSFLFETEDQTLLAHRGSYKTTVLSLFLAIHTVLLPFETVMYFRKTDSDVTEVARQVQKMLCTGVFQQMSHALWGQPMYFTKLNGTEINTTLNRSTKGASQIIGLGIGTSITGKHADLVITDDIVNLKDRVSRAERESTKLAFMELQNIKNRGGRFINTGTPWHKEDAISMMPNVTMYDCYSTGLIGKEELAELRMSMSDSLFAANYELKHIADKDAMFKDPQYTGNVAEIYGGRAHVDAAYGGEDYTAYTIIKEHKDGTYTAYGRLWHKHVDECLIELVNLHAEMQAGSLSCERNADKGYLAKELEDLDFYVRTYHESMNKFLKISTYLRRAWNKIRWLEGTDPEYISQILDYTEHAEHDDAPDSAASLLREMEKGTAHYQGFDGGI